MSKPSTPSKEDKTTTTTATTTTNSSNKNSKGQGTVADLERRLAMLSSDDDLTPAPVVTQAVGADAPALAVADAPVAPVKGGKNALLVRTVQ